MLPRRCHLQTRPHDGAVASGHRCSDKLAMMRFVRVPSKLGCSLEFAVIGPLKNERQLVRRRWRRRLSSARKTTMTRPPRLLQPRENAGVVEGINGCARHQGDREKNTHKAESWGGGAGSRRQDDTNDASGFSQERPMFKETPRHSQNAQLCVGKG